MESNLKMGLLQKFELALYFWVEDELVREYCLNFLYSLA